MLQNITEKKIPKLQLCRETIIALGSECDRAAKTDYCTESCGSCPCQSPPIRCR
jgi:hypothetical protein